MRFKQCKRGGVERTSSMEMTEAPRRDFPPPVKSLLIRFFGSFFALRAAAPPPPLRRAAVRWYSEYHHKRRHTAGRQQTSFGGCRLALKVFLVPNLSAVIAAGRPTSNNNQSRLAQQDQDSSGKDRVECSRVGWESVGGGEVQTDSPCRHHRHRQ